MGIGEAQDYLTATVLGPVKPSVNLCGDVLESLGIRSVTKGSRKAVSLLADLVEQAIRRFRELLARTGDAVMLP